MLLTQPELSQITQIAKISPSLRLKKKTRRNFFGKNIDLHASVKGGQMYFLSPFYFFSKISRWGFDAGDSEKEEIASYSSLSTQTGK